MIPSFGRYGVYYVMLSSVVLCVTDEQEFWGAKFEVLAFSGTDMLSKLMKMQVLEDDEELAYGGDDTPGTERKDIEVRLQLKCSYSSDREFTHHYFFPFISAAIGFSSQDTQICRFSFLVNYKSCIHLTVLRK